MNELSADLALRLTSDMLWTAAILASPLIALTTLASLVVSIFQVVTQIQEASLTFVPKLIVAVATLLVLGGWMLATVTQFATRMIGGIPGFFG